MRVSAKLAQTSAAPATFPHAGAADAPAPAGTPPPTYFPKEESDLATEYIWRLIFTDAKKLQLRPKGRPWATVNYYAAVSPRYGGLHIQFVSGTKGPGYTAPRVYMP
ncbi:hypothetical protein CHLRE_02g143147v5 [Chlamydomonas reinhardtii]|uniref:Uncharacterized protein n=1 Tax=Chlamydomonas reinhardtii TaxID=3055 RepID=A0A2K3E4I4_CHLRE|nr:uncharacterized protein CHLRE_02g143147v5 [Chlamydomonas reinhardtii]PNW87704.1 hypothetical protein CHLRE_02g143147v5 [Chlamydomonas reinhardtii]